MLKIRLVYLFSLIFKSAPYKNSQISKIDEKPY